jgi:hypothetical protein
MQSNNVMIHVRFAPNGTVTEIGERPGELTAQEWFNRLSCDTRNVYQPLSGGRGLFRVSTEQLGALKAMPAHQP